MANNASFQVKKLLKLAAKNKSETIYNCLNNLKGSSKYKGDVFEHFLAGLYTKIGWGAVVCGGKDDKGVDILLYHPHDPAKVYAIIQAKNMKKRLSNKDLRHEYANFFGDAFSSFPGAATQYGCKTLFIIALNGYTKDANKFNNPHQTTHQVYHYEWAYIKNLIQKYAQNNNLHHTFITRFQKSYHNLIALIKPLLIKIKNQVDVKISISILTMITVILMVVSYPSEEALTEEMIERLNKTYLGNLAQQDCQQFNYQLEHCREKLVNKYTKVYGSLQNGLLAHFCGPTNFRKGQCGEHGKKNVWYVLNGEQ